MDDDQRLAQRLAAILPHLNEQQRRILLAADARALGYGGIIRVARAAGVSRSTIHTALQEQALPASEHIRRSGGGCKKTRDRDFTLVADLEALVSPDTWGDPMSPLRWTRKRTRQLAAALQHALAVQPRARLPAGTAVPRQHAHPRA
ncbi:MAG: hypothetical protein M3380_16020, partial [Chloroflexota bacterium]|nr:hypothetical protein [Chloroflexota bacterium]